MKFSISDDKVDAIIYAFADHLGIDPCDAHNYIRPILQAVIDDHLDDLAWWLVNANLREKDKVTKWVWDEVLKDYNLRRNADVPA